MVLSHDGYHRQLQLLQESNLRGLVAVGNWRQQNHHFIINELFNNRKLPGYRLNTKSEIKDDINIQQEKNIALQGNNLAEWLRRLTWVQKVPGSSPGSNIWCSCLKAAFKPLC